MAPDLGIWAVVPRGLLLDYRQEPGPILDRVRPGGLLWAVPVAELASAR